MGLRLSRISFRSGILWILPLLGLLLLTAAATATDRVSIASDGAEGDGHSPCPAISADGRFVAFASAAANLVVDDTNDSYDIFVHDRETGQTERVSVASDGTQSDPVDNPGCPAISADGRFVAFAWEASNLVAGDTNGERDVFVHDRQTGTTVRVSVATDGTEGNKPSNNPKISTHGRFVTFASSASNLVANDGNGVHDVFLHDRDTGATERVSLTNAGNQGNGASAAPALSADGRWVAFTSHATNLVAGDGNGNKDIFVRDRQAGTTVRVSVATNGTEGNGDSDNSALSADGRVVAFDSMAEDLVTGDANLLRDVFVHDLQTGTTDRVSVGTNGAQGDSISGAPDISGDGRFVMFVSNAGNLVPGDTNGKNDIFVHDRHTGSTTRVSVSSDGAEGDNSSGGTFANNNTISEDGLFVAFQSKATNLVDDDINGKTDSFVNRVDVGAGSLFEYAAKIVCGAQTVEPPWRFAPGFYTTTVNIHNPNRASVQLFKKLALTLPPGDQLPGEVLPIAIDELGSDEALQADCVDLRERLFSLEAPDFLFEGYLVIQSPLPLDVTALYTAAALGANGQPGAHSSLHIEQVRERDLGVDLRLTKESQVIDNRQSDALTFHLIVYTMTVENVGDEPATGVLIRDVVELATTNAVGLLGVFATPINLPPGGAIVNISPPAATFPPTVPEPATVTFELELGDLAPGDSVTAQVLTLAVVFVVGQGAGAVLTNTATVGSYEPESSPINNTDVTEDTLYP